MFIIISKICSTDGKTVEACRLIDPATKEVKTVAFDKIREAVLKGEVIKGFKVFESINYVTGHIKRSVTKEKGKFSMSRVPEMNGKGELINPSDKNILMVYGWKGFAEAKEFHLFNYKGEEVLLTVDQFSNKVKAGEVNGALINKKTGKPMIAVELNKEI